MKEFLTRKWAAVDAFFKAKIAPHIAKATPAVSILMMIGVLIVGAALFLAFVAALIFVMVLLPGMIVGFFAWFAWTYMQLGLTYFPSLSPVYQTIPYWHFAWGFAAVILVWRVLRKKSYSSSGSASERGLRK